MLLTGDEEVGSRLAVCGFVAHVDEVLARLVGRTHVNLATLVDHAHFVEVLVELLASLVNRNDCRLPCDISGDPQSLHEFKRGRGTTL